MREIKFRAWNIKNSNQKERMIIPVTLTADGRVIMPDGEDWELPVMQYTGLKDKNGKEIYEGDILKYKTYYYGKEKEIITEVKWLENQPTDLFGEPDFCGYLIRWGKCEIIGNIYENPELIK